jgi:hypothetical protein
MLDAVSVAPELEAALLPTFRHPERLDQLWVGHPVVGPFGEVKRQVRQQGGLRLQKSPAARVRRVATHSGERVLGQVADDDLAFRLGHAVGGRLDTQRLIGT